MKPPVVVIGRHCKTNQCWIAVRFKKTQSVAKISQKVEGAARGRGAGKRVSRAEMFIFATHARAIVESFESPPSPSSLRWHRLKPPRRARTPIIMLPPVPSPSPPPLQPALPVYKPPPNQQRRRPRHQLPALVSTQCGPWEQPHQSRLLCALLREQPIERSAWNASVLFPAARVDRCTQLPISGEPKALDQHAFLTVLLALIFTGPRHLLAMVLGSPRPADRGSSAQGRLQWPKS